MRIPIKLNDFSNTASVFPQQLAKVASNEMVLIELQGSLEVEGDKSGEVIGMLKIDDTDRPTLQIGHNLLEGKIVSLSKPLAVLHLVQAKSPINPMEVDDDSTSGTSRKSFEVVSIIRKKISFPKRPRPLVHNVNVNVNHSPQVTPV